MLLRFLFFFLPSSFLSFTLPLFFFFFFFFLISPTSSRVYRDNAERESEWAFCRSIKQLHFALVTNPAYFSSFWNFSVLFLFQLLLFFLRLSPHRFNLHITTRGRVKLNNYPLLFRKFYFFRFERVRSIKQLHFALITKPAYFSPFGNFLFYSNSFFPSFDSHHDRHTVLICTSPRGFIIYFFDGVKLNNYPLLFRKFYFFRSSDSIDSYALHL